MEALMKEYRDFIIKAEQKAQDDFDKTVIALSGGALGVSFAFIKDIIGPDNISNTILLFLAWLFWASSITCVLASYYTSHLSLRNVIKKIDAGETKAPRLGGFTDWITAIFNALGGILFVAGVVLMSIFIKINLGGTSGN